MTRICWIPLGLIIALLSTFSLALAEERLWLVTEPSEGMPTCEEFFDNWEVQGAPPGLMAMSGYAREVFAAKKCVDKGDVATACRHWQGLLAVIDKMGPPFVAEVSGTHRGKSSVLSLHRKRDNRGHYA